MALLARFVSLLLVSMMDVCQGQYGSTVDMVVAALHWAVAARCLFFHCGVHITTCIRLQILDADYLLLTQQG